MARTRHDDGWLRAMVIVAALAAGAGCDGDTGGACADGESRCEASRFVQSCIDGSWANAEDCAAASRTCAMVAGQAVCRAEGDADTDADTDSDSDTDTDADPRFDAVLTAFEQEMARLGAPGAALAVIEGGEVTLARGFGTRHPDGDEPVRSTTLFRIGSTNKMLTAAGLLRFVDSGDVAVGDAITEHLPDFGFTADASWAPSITVEHLLTHASSIVDYLEVDVIDALKQDSALAEYLNGTFGEIAYLMATPGRMYNYSNPNFYLAGLVQEVHAGRPYRLYLYDRVLAPLGMTRTLFLPSEVLADGDYASGQTHHWQTGAPLVAEPDTYDNGWARPAGYAFSSVLDMAKFVRFLRNGDSAVLSDAQRAAMQAPQIDTEQAAGLAHYGYGLGVNTGFFLGDAFYDTPLINHDGAIPGFSASVVFAPEADCGMITLASTDGAYFSQTLVALLSTLCELPAATTGPDLSVDPSDFDRYAGEYSDPFNVGDIIVRREGDALMVEFPVLDGMGIPYEPELTPVLPQNFQLGIQGTQIGVTFLLDGDGQGEYFRTRSFVGKRVDGPPPHPRPMPDRRALLRRLQVREPLPLLWRLLGDGRH